jgi:hypothetical protein
MKKRKLLVSIALLAIAIFTLVLCVAVYLLTVKWLGAFLASALSILVAGIFAIKAVNWITDWDFRKDYPSYFN